MSVTQIQTPVITDGSVTNAKIADSAVNLDKITFENALVPVGGIIMWSGSIANIPIGWALCNGSNNTPDLRNRFIVGAGSGYGVGATGGSADATLVSHSHTATSSVSDPGHSHAIAPDPGSGGGALIKVLTSTDGSGALIRPASTESQVTGITVSTSVSTEGSAATNANLPPYYALAFIMRVL